MITYLKNKYNYIEDKYPSYMKLVRFVISGGIATSVNILLVFILTEYFNLWYLLGASTGFGVAFLISFILQKFWTFQDKSKEGIHKQAVIFFITVIAGIAVNAILVYLFVENLKFHYLLAQITSGVLIAIANYFAYQKLVFNKYDHRTKNN